MLNLNALMEWPEVESAHSYSKNDSILYALSVGACADPCDERELPFVLEDRLVALPTMVGVLGARFPWLHDASTGVDVRQMLHGESSLRMHAPLPCAGDVISRTSILGVVDRGAGKSATVYFAHDVYETSNSQHLATVQGCFVVRTGGGGGSSGFEARAPQAIPERSPDLVVHCPTLPQAALLYRLTGDRNPLHGDPAVARAAGFDRPILHGACTYGIAGRSLIMALCDGDPARLRALDVRFSAPLYPGETIRIDVWTLVDGAYAFRCVAAGRDVIILNNGRLETARAMP